ncbi:tryptophan--tRNA ligase [Terasakiispira papahanaumokuakeensis]|uniref:Tryptophan--tRNA ligase n=1 Tax=Terasakiispira papahanaumokuakeensis TaxID=197479 RepID=A0A1E2V5I7_9GAMM|nr:tryptophan--tRNA ligase [Terasakiispira papahanaumokuakeensis]ODC02183.1 tryptophan--tRNA ligase [Terasakiispira papahanaumokuakeensis]
MSKTTVLTGITTTGTPHLGNYVGAIRPAIEASRDPNVDACYFLADFHALIKCQDPERVQQSRREIAATWLALGLDTDNATFYRQSDIPEIPELTWLLTCVCAKGLMNRAHAYKAAVAENETDDKKDPDAGITMGLYSYPVLMAADILMFNANKVPVGRDQIQHIEMARDIAARFNHLFKSEFFNLPEAVVDDKVAILSGLDGRKMSKSYNNTIPLFTPEKKLLKLVRKIKTNSLEPGEPKDPETCTLFQIYSAFASGDDVSQMRQRYAEGIGWGEAKNMLFEHLNEQLKGPREEYERLINDPAHVEQVMQAGAEKARERSVPFLKQLRDAVGLAPFV